MSDAPDLEQPEWLTGHDENKARSLGSWIGLFFVAVLGLGSFGIWAYAYSGQVEGDREYVDQLDGRSFPNAAEPICATAKEALSTVPYSLAAEDAAERAGQIDDANKILAEMVAGLRTIDLSGESDRDSAMASQWLDEYEIFVSDRENYATRLRVDPTAQATYTDLGNGLIERRLTWFADVNEMDSCITPKDVG